MTLKNLELTRAEFLSKSYRDSHNLPENGMIVIETTNHDLNTKFKSVEETGIKGYLQSLGAFK